MEEEQVREGTVPFSIPTVDKPCSTYYKIFGDLRSGYPPVIAIHGGPGSGHEYILAFSKLWTRYKFPVVFYDQIGCASSTHLPEKVGDKAFWTIDLMADQLDSLIDALHLRDENGSGYYILGHSYGGILGSYFATRRPKGLRKLILASAPATFDLHVVCLHLSWKHLSQEAQRAMEEAGRTGDYTTQSYKDSELELRRTFWCRADPYPPEALIPTIQNHIDDNTVSLSMYGPTPLECTGSMHGWNCFSALPQINVPTLVYNGDFDLVREEAIAPFLTHIPRVQKVTLANASHMAHIDTAELQDEVLRLVSSFYLQDESWEG